MLLTLDTLAAHSSVNGNIIRLDQNQTVSSAYTTWIADLTNVDKANAATAAIQYRDDILATTWRGRVYRVDR